VHLNRKKHTLLSFLFLGISLAFGQYPTLRERVTNLPNFDKRLVHYGYFLGTNQYDFKFEYIPEYYTSLNYKDIAVEPKAGFNVGLIGDLRINEFFNLRLEPGLYYSQRNLIYPEFAEFEKEGDLKREVKSTFIHIPLMLKINVRRINNYRPFLLTGISTDFNLSSNAKNRDDNRSNVFRTTSHNLNYELGLGFDFYLVYFKFSPSIRGIFSIQNEMLPDNDPNSPWTGKITKMLSRGFAINFTFE